MRKCVYVYVCVCVCVCERERERERFDVSSMSKAVSLLTDTKMWERGSFFCSATFTMMTFSRVTLSITIKKGDCQYNI